MIAIEQQFGDNLVKASIVKLVISNTIVKG